MTGQNGSRRAGRLLALALPVLAACSNAGEDLGFGALGGGQVTAFVFLDRDGSGGTLASPVLDTVLSGIRIGIVALGTTDTVATGLTDAQGLVTIPSVPLGDYRVVVDTGTVGDTVSVQAYSRDTIRLRSVDPRDTVIARVGFPSGSTAQVKAMAAGSRVFVTGVVLAGVATFRDTTAYVSDNAGAIRLTSGRNVGFPQTNQPGDSVRVLGTVAMRDGQPVLDSARIYTFSGQNAPVAVALSTLLAAGADGGARDAALIQITGGEILATSTMAPDFVVQVDDGTGPLDVVLDGNINFQLAQFVVGDTLSGRGILVPNGIGGWVLKPRFTSDVTVN